MKYKVGDMVRVAKPVGNGYGDCIGKTGKITMVMPGFNFPYRIQCIRSNWRDSELELITEANMYKKGDILENGDSSYAYTREVVETLGEIIFTKDSDDDAAYLWTPRQLEKEGWKLKSPTPETVEITIEEIATKFGMTPEQVRIKKED